jgi:two-component system, OmpR family, response regulator
MATTTVLVVDDEPRIREVLQFALEREGYNVATACDGGAALAKVAEGGVDLMVLDVLMPELDGLQVCRRLRQTGSSLPVIFLSSRTEVVDRILGLELGGDDYVPKPFSPREVASRIKAVLRRRAAPRAAITPADGSVAGEVLSHGALEIDIVRHEVRAGTAKVDLTPTEFEVLRALLESPGRLLSRNDLITKVYKVVEERQASSAGEAAAPEVTERTVDTYVRRIRAKFRPLGMDPIETVHGLGYKARDLS